MSNISLLAFKVTTNIIKVTWLINTVTRHIEITSLTYTTLNDKKAERRLNKVVFNKLSLVR